MPSFVGEDGSISWRNCCRLCLGTEDMRLDIFDDNEGEVMLDAIKEFFGFVIYIGDPLPRKLCSACWINVQNWVAFRESCGKTNKDLYDEISSYSYRPDVKEYLIRSGRVRTEETPNIEDLEINLKQCCSDIVVELLNKTQEIEQEYKKNHAPSSNDNLAEDNIEVEPMNNVEKRSEEEIVPIIDFEKGNDRVIEMDNVDEPRTENGENEDEVSHSLPDNEAYDMNYDTEYDDDSPSPSLRASCDENSKTIEINNCTSADRSSKPTISEADSNDLATDESGNRNGNMTPPVIRKEENSSSSVAPIEKQITVNSCADGISVASHGDSNIIQPSIKCEVMEDESFGTGVISTVKGRADALWATIENVCIKNESLAENTNNEQVERGYNLRPRNEFSSLLYNSDWMEDDASMPTPQSRMSPWKCQPCNHYFSKKRSLLLHYSTPTCLGIKVKSFVCRVCSRKFFTLDELAHHQVYHLRIAHHLTDFDLLPCNRCSLRFADQNSLTKHKLSHRPKLVASKKIRYKCGECGERFVNLSPYKVHLSFHEPAVNSTKEGANTSMPVAEYSCSLCPKKFKGEDFLYDHRFGFHGIPDERVTCNVCGAKFRDPKLLTEHERSHKSNPTARKSTMQTIPPLILNRLQDGTVAVVANKKIRCRRCGRLFGSQDELLQHEASQHKTPSPHICRKCMRRFPTRSLLLMHHRTNCSKAIKEDQDKTLVTMKPQGDVSNTACTICKIKFRSEADVKMHMHRHTISGGKCVLKNQSHLGKPLVYKYQCSHCPQLFCSVKSVNSHKKVHDEAKIKFSRLARSISAKDKIMNCTQLPCSQCDMSFETSANLNAHISEIHTPTVKVELVESTPNLDSSTHSVNCPFCLKVFASTYINKHIKLKHRSTITLPIVPPSKIAEKKVLKCRYCSRICSTSYNLKQHESGHDSRRLNGHSCKKCKASFSNYKQLSKHRQSCKVAVSGAKSTAAPRKRPLADSSSSKSPVKGKVSVGSPRSCPICMNSYETANLLELHVMTAHGLEEFKRLQNMVEGTSYVTSPVGSSSKRRSSDVELWQEECNKIMRQINGEHRCSLCRVSFANFQAAIWHKSQHPRGNLYVVQIDDSLYQCTICNKFFNSRSIALDHAQIHSEPYFKTEPQHSRPRSFKCPFCSSTFASEDSIRSHIFYVHPEGAINLS